MLLTILREPEDPGTNHSRETRRFAGVRHADSDGHPIANLVAACR